MSKLETEKAAKKQPFFIGQELETTIEKLSFNGGRGLARINSVVVFVPFTLPGEKVKIKVSKVKKNYAEAELVEVLEKSEFREDPRCEVFGICGGCEWQHISYDFQVSTKETLFKEFFEKNLSSDILIHEIQASKNAYNYRNRIQLHKNKSKYGFRKRNSNQIVGINSCPISKEEINEAMDATAKTVKSHRFQIAFLNGEISVLEISKKHIAPFFQVNDQQNTEMLEYVKSLTADLKINHIYDLFAGAGNFSFELNKHCNKPVTGIEINEKSVQLAKKNCESTDVDFICSDVSDFLLSKEFEPNDLLIVDPPRTGIPSDAINSLAKSSIKNIIYISCNPSTLVRDLKILCEDGLKVVSTKPFDMFPQTSHIESVTILHR